ncbi:MAG: VCBS repeat-containing protein [Ignavibacteriales bacterium]|nr:MAG: VCBS repeat-containing protein [Ignavibacteriales bacterium]
MKIFCTLAIVISLSFSIKPQQFEKITTGSPATDGGDSRAVNWIDYDNDSDLDLFVTNGPQAGQNNFLYRNDGNGTFTKITNVVIAQDGKASDGSTWGDYDNDGDVDLFVANWWGQPNLLYSNNGDGSFTFENSLSPSTGNTYSETGSWGDYDADGWIDLYVCNSFSNLRNILYHNNGDGTFTAITTGPQVTDQQPSRNADWVDYDNNGTLDLFVTNEENQHNALYKNNGAGAFEKVNGINIVSNNGNSTSSNWEDIDNDGDFDLFVANYGNQANFLYMNNGDGSFTRITQGSVVTDGGSSFGSNLGDIDNDGDLDLIVTNAFTGSAQTNNFLYLNNGDGTFTKDSSNVTTDGGWSYGCAFGDYDDDGYLDLFVAKCYQANENNALFHNTGGSNNWLKMNLTGTTSNTSAIGTIVKIKSTINGSPVWQMRKVAGQHGYCGQTLQLHFGLGNSTVVDSISIEWPTGVIETFEAQQVNQVITITEDSTLSDNSELDTKQYNFHLHQNYPNPFNPETKITFTLEESGSIDLSVYNSLGEKITSLARGYHTSGLHSVNFKSVNSPSGIYFYVLSNGTKSLTGKMILLK